MAATLPQIIVAAEIATTTGPQAGESSGSAETNIRSSAAKPATFAPTDIKATAAEGAP